MLVQGPRPENILFLIHEVFESIIEESFNGVSYELFVPCPDCILKEVSLWLNSNLIRSTSQFRKSHVPPLKARISLHICTVFLCG